MIFYHQYWYLGSDYVELSVVFISSGFYRFSYSFDDELGYIKLLFCWTRPYYGFYVWSYRFIRLHALSLKVFHLILLGKVPFIGSYDKSSICNCTIYWLVSSVIYAVGQDVLNNLTSLLYIWSSFCLVKELIRSHPSSVGIFIWTG